MLLLVMIFGQKYGKLHESLLIEQCSTELRANLKLQETYLESLFLKVGD